MIHNQLPRVYYGIVMFFILEPIHFNIHLEVSWNRGTPKSSILVGFFLYKPTILGHPIHGKPHLYEALAILARSKDFGLGLPRDRPLRRGLGRPAADHVRRLSRWPHRNSSIEFMGLSCKLSRENQSNDCSWGLSNTNMWYHVMFEMRGFPTEFTIPCIHASR